MDTSDIQSLHSTLLTCWNHADARAMASLFLPDSNMIGFDGSQINGSRAIETELSQIFADHQTASFVWKVEEIRFLNDSCAILRAIVGMVPPGKDSINPALNAIQSLIAIKKEDSWKIALFQNTPAQFHGRPQLV